MPDITVLLMPLDDGFRAAVGGTALDSPTLIGFGARIENALKANVSKDVEVEYALSPELKARFRSCKLCDGTERIEIDGSFAAQSLANGYSEYDFSQRATRTCTDCKGLGVEIPGFWSDDQ